MTKTPCVKVSISVILPNGEEAAHRVRHLPIKGEDFAAVVACALGVTYGAVSNQLPLYDEVVARMVDWLADNGVLVPDHGDGYMDEPLRDFIEAARTFLDARNEDRRERERQQKQSGQGG